MYVSDVSSNVVGINESFIANRARVITFVRMRFKMTLQLGRGDCLEATYFTLKDTIVGMGEEMLTKCFIA